MNLIRISFSIYSISHPLYAHGIFQTIPLRFERTLHSKSIILHLNRKSESKVMNTNNNLQRQNNCQMLLSFLRIYYASLRLFDYR